MEGNGGATGRKVKERVTQCHCEFVTTLSVLPFFVFYARLLLELVCTRGMKPLDACRLHTYLPFFNPRRAASLLLASSSPPCPRASKFSNSHLCLARERETWLQGVEVLVSFRKPWLFVFDVREKSFDSIVCRTIFFSFS